MTGRTLRFGNYEVPIDEGVDIEDAKRDLADLIPGVHNMSVYQDEATGDYELRPEVATKG